MHAAACLRAQNGAASRNTSSRPAALPRSVQPRFDVMQRCTASHSTAPAASHRTASPSSSSRPAALPSTAQLRFDVMWRCAASPSTAPAAPHRTASRFASRHSAAHQHCEAYLHCLTQHRRCCRHLHRSSTGPCLLAFGGHLHTYKSVRFRAFDDALRRAQCMHLCACVLH